MSVPPYLEFLTELCLAHASQTSAAFAALRSFGFTRVMRQRVALHLYMALYVADDESHMVVRRAYDAALEA